jgi:predicted LPLAT superfamily acyltransferase
MKTESKWEGQSKGKVLGYKFFVFTIQKFGLYPAYFFLRFVSFYYFLTSKANRFIRQYYRTAFKMSTLRAFFSVYRNNTLLGETIIDKFAIMSGIKTDFKIIHENGEVLDKIAQLGKGGILVSAHVGNWEIAGQGLNRLNTPFNVLMYENEKSELRDYMNEVMQKKKINIITIDEVNKSHIIELHKLFSNKEILVMHGDRYREGTKTFTADFFGKPAKFPSGPFILAAKFGVPLCITFSNKSSANTYAFYSADPIEVSRTRSEAELEAACQKMLGIYIRELEKRLRQYPDQWFNYYDFWA